MAQPTSGAATDELAKALEKQAETIDKLMEQNKLLEREKEEALRTLGRVMNRAEALELDKEEAAKEIARLENERASMRDSFTSLERQMQELSRAHQEVSQQLEEAHRVAEDMKQTKLEVESNIKEAEKLATNTVGDSDGQGTGGLVAKLRAELDEKDALLEALKAVLQQVTVQVQARSLHVQDLMIAQTHTAIRLQESEKGLSSMASIHRTLWRDLQKANPALAASLSTEVVKSLQSPSGVSSSGSALNSSDLGHLRAQNRKLERLRKASNAKARELAFEKEHYVQELEQKAQVIERLTQQLESLPAQVRRRLALSSAEELQMRTSANALKDQQRKARGKGSRSTTTHTRNEHLRRPAAGYRPSSSPHDRRTANGNGQVASDRFFSTATSPMLSPRAVPSHAARTLQQSAGRTPRSKPSTPAGAEKRGQFMHFRSPNPAAQRQEQKWWVRSPGARRKQSPV